MFTKKDKKILRILAKFLLRKRGGLSDEPSLETFHKKERISVIIHYCCFYERNKERWIEAEHLLTDPFAMYGYAVDIIKGRWIEREEEIKKEPSVWDKYCRRFGVR